MKVLLHLAMYIAFCSSVSYGQSTELTELRDMYSKTYELPSGEKQSVIQGGAAHYFNGASWEEIDPTITATATTLYNSTNVIASVFPVQPSINATIDFTINGYSIELSLQKEVVQFSNGITTLTTLDTWEQADYTTNEITYTETNSGVQDVYQISKGQIKNDLLLNASPNTFAASDVYYGFREKLRLPSGWSLQNAVQENDPKTNHGILVIDETNTPQLMIPAPIIFDALGMENNGSMSNDAAFVIEEENGDWYISTLVSSEWLNAPERVFPVTFDPTFTVAAATGGWQSQNNFVDNPNFVFIGVCCGNLEHRAWLQWNIASIPTNACVSLVELELLVNGTGGQVAELVHAYDMMTTNSLNVWGPYGAINTAVYNDQATGWYSSFTITGIGTYGWYDLGPNAYADMMAMVNTFGTYQVALVFDNEPSTNWKRLTASGCSIRVTYEDPPCTILPIELSDFDVACVDGQAEISWSTNSEINNDYFTVSKSIDGIQFTDLASVPGAGNSNTPLDYTIYDDARQTEPVYYRLRQTDLNGATEVYTPHVFHGCDSDVPNVSTEQGNRVRIRGNAIQEVTLLDLMGRTINQKTNSADATSILMASEVTGGLYVVRVLHDAGHVFTQHVYLAR